MGLPILDLHHDLHWTKRKQKTDYKIYMVFWPMSLSNNVETTNKMSDSASGTFLQKC